MLDAQENTLLNPVISIELSSKILAVVQGKINSWEENYQHCRLNNPKISLFPRIYKQYNLEFNSLTENVYLINLWSKFINESLSHFLDPEVYYLMQHYLAGSNQLINMHENLIELEPGKQVNLHLSDIFSFVNNSNLNYSPSFEIIKSVMESTMFDLFVVYLEQAIAQVSCLENNIVTLMRIENFDDISIHYAKETLMNVGKIFKRINNFGTNLSTKKLELFEEQLNAITATIQPNDIFHLTFGTNGYSLQIFPLLIDHARVYAWYDQPEITFGDQHSSYFGLHIDPAFADNLALLQCCRRTNLYVNKYGFGKEYNLQVLHNPKLNKKNFLLFNDGNVDVLCRDYSKKAREYFAHTKYIELSITILERLLHKGVIVLIGSHFSHLDNERQNIGSFKLKELTMLKNAYPYNFHLVCSGINTQPVLIEELQHNVEDILGYSKLIKLLTEHSEDKINTSLASNKTMQSVFFQKKDLVVNESFSVFSNNDSFQIIDRISFVSEEYAEENNNFYPKDQHKCVIS